MSTHFSPDFPPDYNVHASRSEVKLSPLELNPVTGDIGRSLLAVSINLWGSRVYADVAAEMLCFEARVASQNFMLRNGWSSLDPELLGEGRLASNILEHRARKQWNDQCYPFSLQPQKLRDEDVRLVAGMTDQSHLFRYVEVGG